MMTSLARRQHLVTVAPESRVARRRALVSRSTSARVTLTAVITAPAIARSRSRAMVSVSGSSGTAQRFAPAYVGPKLPAGELNRARLRRTGDAGGFEAAGN